MLFNSYIYIAVFLPLMFAGYFFFNRHKLPLMANIWLGLGSMVYYGWWKIEYLPIFFISILLNFAIGSKLAKGVSGVFRRKILLGLGIVLNLGLLGYFKYADFLIENVNHVVSGDIGLLHLTLPLGISFFTFQQLTFLVDSYNGELFETNIVNYSLFVSFFPQLIAGPIVHHKEMMPQFASIKNKIWNNANIATGLFVFSIGLFKKVVLADTLSTWASVGYDQAESLRFFEAWATSLTYSFQLYFDFSGYSDMAMGGALLFNITLPFNFNSPYKSLSIQEFWRRWHMTLSRFLRDYIYIPLGGNQSGRYRTYSNLMATFILGGIWHGAGWTFIIWGALHGIAITIQRLWSDRNIRLHSLIAWIITFNFVNITWIFFRARKWEDAMKVLRGMISWETISLPELPRLGNPLLTTMTGLKNINGNLLMILFISVSFIIVLALKNTNHYMESFTPKWFYLFGTMLMFLIAIYFLNTPTEFLYFNF